MFTDSCAPQRISALRSAWGVEPHQRIVLLPGRLTGWKGQKVLIEAARQLRDAGDEDTAFILAGDARSSRPQHGWQHP